METVDGTDVGEDSLNDITGEGGARAGLLQESGTENLQEDQAVITDGRCKQNPAGWACLELLPGPAGAASTHK